MKKLLLALAFLPAFSFAQKTTSDGSMEIPLNPNEVGLNLFSINRFDTYKDMVDKRHSSADFHFFSGVYYKYHFLNGGALRASFDYTQKLIVTDFKTDIYIPYFYNSTGVRKNIGFSAGYEHSFFKWKVQPYVFADAMMSYENYSGHASYYGDFTSGTNEPFSEETFEYGLQGGIGVHYAINPFIKISLESNAQGFVSIFQDVQHAGDKYTSFGGHINPVSKLGFAVTF